MKFQNRHIAYGIGILGLISIFWWLTNNPANNLEVSNPGMDNQDKALQSFVEQINIGEFFERFKKSTDELNESWLNFRGADFDNISKSPIKLKDEFVNDKSPVIWSVELGEGHSGAAIYKGEVYVLDYDEELKSDMLRCFSLTTGEEIWRRWYNVHVKRNHGMSRTVPAVTEDYIVTIGPRCHVMVVDREDGDFLWGIDMEKDYAAEVPLWYTGQCPLIDGDEVILAPVGEILMMGVDIKTGEVNWTTPNENGWKMSHSSIIPYTFNEKKMFLYAADGGICGISAEENDRGHILFSSNEWNHSVVAPSALAMPDGKIFLTAGYGAGSMMIQLSGSDDNFKVTVLDEYKANEGLACEQQTPVYWNGHLFGILPKDGGSLRNQFICVDPSNTREVVWSSGKTTRFGLGPFMIADGKFYLLNDDGTLFIIKPSTEKYIELDQFKLIDGHDAWAPIAVADGFMVLRDANTMMGLDMRN